jgi:hypothetical protein
MRSPRRTRPVPRLLSPGKTRANARPVAILADPRARVLSGAHQRCTRKMSPGRDRPRGRSRGRHTRSVYRCPGRRRGRPRIGGTASINGSSWVTSWRVPPVGMVASGIRRPRRSRGACCRSCPGPPETARWPPHPSSPGCDWSRPRPREVQKVRGAQLGQQQPVQPRPGPPRRSVAQPPAPASPSPYHCAAGTRIS